MFEIELRTFPYYIVRFKLSKVLTQEKKEAEVVSILHSTI